MTIRAYIKQVAHHTAQSFWKKYYRDRGGEELAETLDNVPQTGRADPRQGSESPSLFFRQAVGAWTKKRRSLGPIFCRLS